MISLAETIDGLVKKKMEIERWKSEHPEQVEIVRMVEDYMRLFDDVYRQVQVPIVTNPVTINPLPSPLSPWPYKITCDTKM